MQNWYGLETYILSKIGIFSYFYFGMLYHVKFILFVTLCLIAVYLYQRSKTSVKSTQIGTVDFGTFCSVVYGAVAATWVAVALYDLAIHFYIQRAIPAENVVQRLDFIARAEVVAGEGFVQYFLFLIPALIVLSRNREINLRSILAPAPMSMMRILLFFSVYTLAIAVFIYLISLIFGMPKTQTLFTLPRLVKELKNVSAIFSYSYFIVMIIIISGGKELVFRGVIFPYFREHIGTRLALILESISFALYGKDLYEFSIFFVTGALLTFLYQQTKSIFLPVVVHGSLLLIATILGT
jgi:membrane protease YdiL (CAAX protease family)